MSSRSQPGSPELSEAKGWESPCDPQGHHEQLAVEMELEELRARSQRAVELFDARLKQTKNASGFIRRLRAVIEGASA